MVFHVEHYIHICVHGGLMRPLSRGRASVTKNILERTSISLFLDRFRLVYAGQEREAQIFLDKEELRGMRFSWKEGDENPVPASVLW